MATTLRPGMDEYAPAFAGYVARVAEDEDIVAVLASQLDQVLDLLGRIGEDRADFRYATGKWSTKEVTGHLSDTERVFAYRALRIGRGDTTPLPNFDDQAYVAELRTHDRTLADFATEWGTVRRATLALFGGLPDAAWCRRGIASDQPISVRALAYVTAGHTRHHADVLQARYTG